jgi:HPt (histidine-containing phosphotransfer) domain-containing protein
MEPVFNLSELLVRVDNDSDLLRDVIAMGKTEIPRHIHLLREAAAQSDVKNIQNLGHAMKGMLLHLAAPRAAAAAGHLEQLGRSADAATVDSAVTIFESEIAKLITELEAYTLKVRQ